MARGPRTACWPPDRERVHPHPGVGSPIPGGGACFLLKRTLKAQTGAVTVTVVLAEDSYLMREGVSRLLESDQAIKLVATGADLESLLAAVEEHSPDVVVTDIRMPPTSTDEGIQAAEAFRESHPELGVVVLSQYDEPEYALKLLARGA